VLPAEERTQFEPVQGAAEGPDLPLEVGEGALPFPRGQFGEFLQIGHLPTEAV